MRTSRSTEKQFNFSSHQQWEGRRPGRGRGCTLHTGRSSWDSAEPPGKDGEGGGREEEAAHKDRFGRGSACAPAENIIVTQRTSETKFMSWLWCRTLYRNEPVLTQAERHNQPLISSGCFLVFMWCCHRLSKSRRPQPSQHKYALYLCLHPEWDWPLPNMNFVVKFVFKEHSDSSFLMERVAEHHYRMVCVRRV